MQLTTNEVVESAVSALKAGKPWLLTRLGDGEMLAMRSVGISDKAARENIPWNKHLGMIPDAAEKTQWINLTKASVTASDVLGLHDQGVTTKFKESGDTLRGLLNGCIKGQECPANIHLHLQQENGYARILEAASGVWLFSGHPLAKPFRQTLWKDRNPKLVKWFVLPLQCRYFGQKTSWEAWKKGILPEIGKLPDMKGCVVFFGGGVPGKAVLAAVKDRGGVILDIGSVFDQWAGFITRGRGKGRGARSEKNALNPA